MKDCVHVHGWLVQYGPRVLACVPVHHPQPPTPLTTDHCTSPAHAALSAAWGAPMRRRWSAAMRRF